MSKFTVIPIDKCKLGYVYAGVGRNAHVGIYIGDGRFSIPRYKFGFYLYPAIHYNADENFGTFQPLIEMGKVPKECMSDHHTKLEYLLKKSEEANNKYDLPDTECYIKEQEIEKE